MFEIRIINRDRRVYGQDQDLFDEGGKKSENLFNDDWVIYDTLGLTGHFIGKDGEKIKEVRHYTGEFFSEIDKDYIRECEWEPL